ncbi:hypothetical protein [Sphingobacterium multivorum]|uniref:hypothetical protein n=1 Tax=Sphingobacterium multivorum TaxID=28454 RepID=UPI00345E889C
MNLIKFIKTNVMPILGLAIAAGLSTWSLTSASTTKYADPMDWYERQPNGTYQLLSGGPTDEPSNGCQEAITDLCAKGFAPGTAPSVINDSTPSDAQRYHVEP